MWSYRVPLADSTAWEPWKPRPPPQDSPSHIPQTRPDQISPDLGQSMVDQNPTTNLGSLPFRALQTCRCVSHQAMPVDPVFAFLVFSLPQHDIFSVSVAFGFDETNTSLLMPDLHEVSKVPVQIIWLINFACIKCIYCVLCQCVRLICISAHVYVRFCLCVLCMLRATAPVTRGSKCMCVFMHGRVCLCMG